MLLGCDFSCAPSARKPIVLALGHATAGGVALLRLERFASLEAWCRWLADQPAWIGAFDFPFGLPRELVAHLGWPMQWQPLIAHYAGLDRALIRQTFVAFCAARPVGGKFAHRATDAPAGSSPSMKWVNPPVAFMLHAGVPRLLEAGAALPGLHVPASAATRIALEGYPGLLARELIGRRSYKSDEAARQTVPRREARAELLAALEGGSTRLGLRLALGDAEREVLLADARGDCLDAVLCLVQAAWGAARRASAGPGYGLPAAMDPLEGWIVTA
ncbi:DUF429 domain-containing protein [Variovorax sp. WS11]|uniref:DUF429 domain-containing protein n=1 Tax=Variovorax sp. WS11 TaxID=1105204 RepID=UPI000D0D41D3|nr:DUF429 domain-containing protein [Variovorax sp. WS11]NDZ16221.1 DUF429 domain-containing protein [Variovorax sp. WS11]PSL84068.1 DUF429 domain-containing protein [Variovorax sp. WS11]